jgi:hypothetical protein
MILWRHTFMTIAVMLVWCSTAPATGEHAKPVKVKACREASRLPPITRRCVAAAIAEDAYINAAAHSLDFHTIYSFRPSSSQWRFVIQEGDEAHPPADGAEWFIRVDRSSGKVEVDPGR